MPPENCLLNLDVYKRQGYGWAEAFFNPRKQIQMIDEQLMERHQLAISDLVKRNL